MGKEGVVKPIRFSQHSLTKLAILAAHGWELSKDEIETTVRGPDRIDEGYKGRKIAQRRLDGHVLRVVFEEAIDEIVIVTMYPGRRERYDKD